MDQMNCGIGEEISKVYSNFMPILRKMEHDGYLTTITKTVSDIYKAETDFALQGGLSRVEEDRHRGGRD